MSLTGKTHASLFLQTLPMENRRPQRAASADLYQVHTPGLSSLHLVAIMETRNRTELAPSHLLNSPQPTHTAPGKKEANTAYRAVFLNSRNSHMGLYVGPSFPRPYAAPLPMEPAVPSPSRHLGHRCPDNSCVTPHPLLIHTDVTRPCSSIADGLSLCESKNLSHLSSHPYLD